MVRKTLLMALTMLFALTLGVLAKPTGTITVGMLSDCETLSPLVSENSSETDIMNGISQGLFTLDNKSNLVPTLAVEVPSKKNGGISKDDKVFTFKLRKGVKWHDGKPFSAKDVEFTWKAYLNEKVPVPSRDPFDKITKFEILDDYTVRMTLKSVVASFLLSWTGPGILPAHYFEKFEGQALADALNKSGKFSRHPIGTGPFKFKEWKSDSYIALEANENYWGDEPGLAKVIFKVIPDTNTMVTQLKTGEVDVCQIQPKDYDLIKNLPGSKVTKDPAAIYLHMTFNLRNDILSEKAVRQALAYGLPRQLIIDKVLAGIGSLGSAPLSPLSWAYNDKNSDTYPFDQKKAESLLEKAGWKVGKDGYRYKGGKKLTVEICTNTGNKTREQIEVIAQQYWKEIGIDLTIRNYEANTLFGDILENFKFDIICFGWVTTSDPDSLYSLFHSKMIPTKANGMDGQNYAGYVNKEVDRLLTEAKELTDRDDRIPLYLKFQDIVVDELPLLYVYDYVNINARPTNLKNFKPGVYTNGRFWNIGEWSLTK